jgi:cytidylate kinase
MFEKIAKKLLGMYLKYAQQTEQRIPDIILSGHAGAGKSSIAREVATIANYDYLYSNPDWGAEIKRAAFFEMNSRTASTMDELYELLSTTHRVDFIKDGTSHSVLSSLMKLMI